MKGGYAIILLCNYSEREKIVVTCIKNYKQNITPDQNTKKKTYKEQNKTTKKILAQAYKKQIG